MWRYYLLYNICCENRLNIPNTFCEDLFINYVDSVSLQIPAAEKRAPKLIADSCELPTTRLPELKTSEEQAVLSASLQLSLQSSQYIFNKWSHLDNLEKSHVLFVSVIDPSIFSLCWNKCNFTLASKLWC